MYGAVKAYRICVYYQCPLDKAQAKSNFRNVLIWRLDW